MFCHHLTCALSTSRSSTHLVQFGCRLGGLTGAAGVPVIGSAATVASAPFHQQTSREEDGIGGPQLLAQVDGVVARGTAVPLDVVVETVQINWAARGNHIC